MSLAERIDLLLGEVALGELVAAYFNVDGPFAGHTFDDVGENAPYRITSDDLLAVTLLDIVYDPPAVRALLGDADRWSGLLRAIPGGTPLWEMTDDTYASADALWHELVELPGVGPTKAGKLMARKRPHLIPIYDDVIGTFLIPGEAGLWNDLRSALQSMVRRSRIDALAEGLASTPTTLRILDVAIWMRCGNSTNARAARDAAGLPVEPLAS